MNDRATIIRNLLNFNGSLEKLAAELKGLSWDFDGMPEEMGGQHMTIVLKRYIEGVVSGDDLERWANLIEGRDDIDMPNEFSFLRDFIHELANPELSGRINREIALKMLDFIENKPKVS